ncbi:MAG: hypothetical protein Q7S24_00500, partial [bacterium]|nr:hypothetical protein [bacterium]
TTTSDNDADGKITPSVINKKIIYSIEQYGFTLQLPNTWKDYTTKNRILDWGTFGTSASIDFGFAIQDSLFNISIHPKDQWQRIKDETGPTPTYLGENEKYIFGYATAQDAKNDTIVERMGETSSIIKTFTILPLPTTTITYYLLQTKNTFCNGGNMDSVGYKNALTKKITLTELSRITTTEKIKITLRLAADAQKFNDAYTNIANTTFVNGVVTMNSAGGWPGSSIFYCAWKPFVEKNLEQFAEVREIKWVPEQ